MTPLIRQYRNWVLMVLLSILLFSCKKEDKKNPISFTIKSTIPYNGTPIPGVKYTVREYKGGLDGIFSEPNYTDWEITGVTDASGLAQVNFNPKKNTKYQYEIYFDYSGIQLPAGINDVQLVNAPSYDYIPKDGYQKEYDIRVLPMMQINYKMENVNCSGPSDSMRIILRNIDEQDYYYDFLNNDWSPYFIGCYTDLDNFNSTSGRYVYKIQVIRNGVKNEYLDTILIAPGLNNNLFIEY